MKKLVLISAYFGKLPECFNLWLLSAAENKDIDFLLYSDCDFKQYLPLPENVKVIPVSFEEMKEKFRSKFDFEIALDTPYKLCDYKPAYGYVLQEDIKDYSFWGHIDIDTVLGNILKFLPDDEYDKYYILGHLCIYRNTEENNCRFKLDGGMDYKWVFTTKTVCIFDEVGGMQKKYNLHKIPSYVSRDYADITKRKHRFTLSYAFNELYKTPVINYEYQVFYYENGGVFRDYIENGEIKTEEFNYIHFSSRSLPDKTDGCRAFYITNSGFYPKNEKVTKEIIEKYNPLSPVLDKKADRKWKIFDVKLKIRRKLIRIKERL